jgi:pilus assembly protein FimV
MDAGILRHWNQQDRRQGRRGTRSAAAALVLLACALDAWALSAGSPRGTPLIGRPLELAIPVRWERGESVPCVRAEFLQGESPGGPLTWRIDRTGETTGLLRLTSALPVQEPMVTVQVALGCSEQLARQYVMLAEPPNEAREAQAEAALAPELPVALAPLALATSPMLGSATPASAARSEPSPAAASVPPRRPRAASARARTAKGAGGVAAATPPAKTKTTDATGGRPRLKLEPIDVEIDEAPVLRLSNALSVPPAGPGSAGTASPNARDVFQALNSTPEQQAAQAQSARAVASELRAMRDLVQRYGAESRATTQRLEKVSGERDLILNLMIAMVLLLGAGFAYLLWLRSRDSAMRRVWWEEEHGDALAAAARRSAAASPALAAAAGATVGVAAVAQAAPSPRPAPAGSGVTEPGSDAFIELPDFLSADHSRVPTADELLALQERTDFFLAVDQPDKAVHLLESQLHEHTGNRPFVWLDLLDLCRRLARRDDYERLRIAFQKLFATPLPAFDAATPYSGGLQAHAGALARITAAWPSRRVLKAIEESLFEEPRPGSIAFDLEASRELLLLHRIASEVLAAEREAACVAEPYLGGERFPDTFLTPLAAAAPATRAAAAPDIDLGELGPFLADIEFDLPAAPPPSRRDAS